MCVRACFGMRTCISAWVRRRFDAKAIPPEGAEVASFDQSPLSKIDGVTNFVRTLRQTVSSQLAGTDVIITIALLITPQNGRYLAVTLRRTNQKTEAPSVGCQP